eukprot:s2565_g4.t1
MTCALIDSGLGAFPCPIFGSTQMGMSQYLDPVQKRKFYLGGYQVFYQGSKFCSFLIMFLVWGCANIILFNLFLSFAPNMLYISQRFEMTPFAFTVDNLLMIFNSILQAQMCLRARQILDQAYEI